MSVCTIARDQNGEIQEVYAPNQNPSILYRDILESVNDKEKALRMWARAYTPTFKKKFGDWELVSQALSFVDKLSGVYKDMFKANPQQTLYEVSVQAHSSAIEKKEATRIFGKQIVDYATELFPDARVGKPYKPAIPKGIDQNGEPLATYVMNPKEKQQFTRIEVAPETKGMTPVAMAERLSKKLNIPFDFDGNLNKLGTVRNGMVIINPNSLAIDTVFHEFSHPFVEAIRKTNPSLYKNLSQRAGNFTYNGQLLSDFVKQTYPDLKEGSDEYISELITTAIGLEGATAGSINDGNDRTKFTEWMKTVFRKIAEYLNALINDPSRIIKPEELDLRMTIADLADLMRLENQIDVGLTPDFTADQAASATQAQTWGSRATIDYFEAEQSKIKLEESGDISYYTNGSIDPITNTLRKFTRLTEYTYANFANTQNKDSFDPEKWLDTQTAKVFRDAGADLADKIPYGAFPNPLSYDEIKAEIKKGYEESRYRGKILHKMIEGYLKFKDTNHFADEIDTLRQQGGISEYDLLWFDEKRIQKMMEQLGINSEEFNNTDIAFRDNIASELMMVNETLGIGTSNDGIIEHSDKAVSFVDYKTGSKFLADENTIRKMQYTNGMTSPIYDSKLDRAKIELVMRMVVAKMNKPDLKVRDLKIAYISRYYGTQIRNVDVQNYLDFINNNMRITIQELEKEAKKDPSLKPKLEQKKKEYKAMKDAKVFDFYNYQGENKIFEQDADLQTIVEPEKKLEFLKNKVASKSRQSLLKDGENAVSRDTLKGIKNAVLTVLNSFKSANVTSVESAGNKDISYFASKTLGLRDQANAYLQSFSQLFETSMDKVTKKTNELLGEQSAFRKADRALHKEYFERTGRPVAKGAKTFSYSKGNTPVPANEQGIFDFMYTWKSVAGEMKRVGATYTEQDVKDGKITQAQWDYYQASKKVLKDLYEGVRNKVAYVNQYGKAVTYGEEYIKNDGYNYKAWSDSFLPTIPFQNAEEIIEKNILTKQLNPVSITKEYFLNYKDRYDMAIQNEDRFNIGVPLKYMSSEFLEDDEHSYNVTQAVDIFARHMIQKEELDDVYDIGQATIAVMSDVTDPNNKDRKNNLKLENAIFALDSFINQQILGRRRMTLRYTKNEVFNKRVDMFLDNIGGFISKNAFWFAPVTATFNGLYGVFTNTKEGLIGSLSKRLFGEENAVSLSHMALAAKISGIHQAYNLTKQSNIKRQFNEDWEGSYYKDKVNFMSKVFRLSNKNYNYTDASLMMGVHNRIFIGDNAYAAQGLGEDLSNETLVIASMLAMKVAVKTLDSNGQAVTKYYKKDGTYTTDPNDKNIQNMWDAYEFNETTKEYEYKGPTRFIDNQGQEVKGLTTLETLKIKTYLERMYGAYSPEQKTHLERYALGRMVMKFRKFQIMNIKENFTLNSHQKYVGDYVQMYNADGSPKLKDGQPMYEWKSEEMRSRCLVLASLVGSFFNTKGSKSWSEMSVEEKKQFTRLAIQLTFYGITIALGMGAMIPPEDKDKLYAKRIMRLTEDLSSVSIVDLMRGATTIDSYPTQLYKAANASGEFFRSVLTDDIVSSGPYKGDYKGWNTLEDFIPVYHATNQAKKLLAGE
jgi:hypothetical protein